jgi:hypothetical protein
MGRERRARGVEHCALGIRLPLELRFVLVQPRPEGFELALVLLVMVGDGIEADRQHRRGDPPAPARAMANEDHRRLPIGRRRRMGSGMPRVYSALFSPLSRFVSTNSTSTPLLMRCETSSASQFVRRMQPCDEA